MELKKAIGLIEARRKKQKMTRKELCRRIKISPQGWSKIVSGATMPGYGKVLAGFEAVGLKIIVTQEDLI